MAARRRQNRFWSHERYNLRLLKLCGANVAEELELLKLVCQRLEEAGIAYMLTGSLAANFYAVPRMTRDIDIVIEKVKT